MKKKENVELCEDDLKEMMQDDLGLKDLFDEVPYWIVQLIEQLIHSGWKKDGPPPPKKS